MLQRRPSLARGLIVPGSSWHRRHRQRLLPRAAAGWLVLLLRWLPAAKVALGEAAHVCSPHVARHGHDEAPRCVVLAKEGLHLAPPQALQVGGEADHGPPAGGRAGGGDGHGGSIGSVRM